MSTGKGCGFDIPVGEGRVVAVLTDYVTHLSFWQRAFEAVGATAALTHTAKMPGVVLLSTSGPDGRLLHAFNVTSGYAQTFTAAERGKPLFGGESLRLPGQSAVMLPLGLTVGGLTVVYATAEITGHEDGSVTFRSVGDEAVVAVEGRASCEGAKASYEQGRTLFRVRRQEFTVRRD